MINYHFKLPQEQLPTRDTIRTLSIQKNEPSWLLEWRLQALDCFHQLPLPPYGPDLSGLSLENICYYVQPFERKKKQWDDIPQQIRKTFDSLGISLAEQEVLAGVGAQLESQVVYEQLKQEWRDQGVVFCSMDTAIHEHADLVKKYLGTLVSFREHKFAALNAALWSGGSFVYVPAGVLLTAPVQAYFRMEQERMGQFERTLIVVEKGACLEYVEGCSAPVQTESSLHAAVVEIFAHEESRVSYTTVQNWAAHVYNLVTKRACVYKNAHVSWLDGNFGSKITMKYPTTILQEEGACGELISLSVAHTGQEQDTGGTMVHKAPHTRSLMLSKTLGYGGSSCYRGGVVINQGAHHAHARVQCDGFMIEPHSSVASFPRLSIQEPTARIEHEASLTAFSDEQLRYIRSRGLRAHDGMRLIIQGFIKPFISRIPLEYAVELERLCDQQVYRE